MDDLNKILNKYPSLKKDIQFIEMISSYGRHIARKTLNTAIENIKNNSNGGIISTELAVNLIDRTNTYHNE